MQVKNLAIWVNGAKPSYGWEDDSVTYKQLVNQKLAPARRKADKLQKTIDSHHIKKIKGREYWYLWEDGRWSSRGSAENGSDPRKEIIAERDKLLKAIAKEEEKLLGCFVKEQDGHVVLDVRLFKLHIDKQLPTGAILVSELLNGRKE